MSKKWTLVEAEIEKKVVNGTPITQMRPTATNPANKGDIANGIKKRRQSRSYGRDRASSSGDYGLEEDAFYQSMSEADILYAVHIACQNVEYIFSSDNLAQDIYVRSLMDSAGYVPLLYILQYPDLMHSAAPSESILQSLAKNSKVVEVDTPNETIRLKEKWEQWLLPNEYGGRGLAHRYIKDSYISGITSSSLSPNAKEFLANSPGVSATSLRATANEFAPRAT